MSIKVTKKSGIQQDGNIVQQLLFRYLPYWPLFVVMLILGVAAAYLYIRYAVPVYQANASILIKDEKKGVNDSKVVDQMNLFGSNKIVENEIEMIRSRGLLKNVVEKLNLYAPVSCRIVSYLRFSLKKTKQNNICSSVQVDHHHRKEYHSFLPQ